MKRFGTNAIGTGLIAIATLTGTPSIPEFARGWVLSVDVVFVWHNYTATPGRWWFSKIKPIICCEVRKHNIISLLILGKLYDISDSILQPIQHRNTSPNEFHKVLQKMGKYWKLKEEIHRWNKATVKESTKKLKVELLEQGRKQGREEFSNILAGHLTWIGNKIYLTTSDFIVYNHYKIDLKLTSIINFRA